MAYTTIDNPELYFQTKIYTGDGNDDRDIVFDVTDTSMQPNMLWSARRDSGDNLSIYDSVRGDGKELRTAESGGEYDRSDNIQALNSNGFQVGTDGQVNADSGTYVSWAWKESATSGFDIVARTGDGNAGTVSHNLSAVPRFIITKCRSATEQWIVQNGSLGATKHLILDSNAAESTAGNRWNDTTPTTSVYSIGTDADVNGNTETFIDYVFASVQGFSKVGGSYKGNGANNFIYTGFSPAWVMIKKTDDTHDWHIFDNKRDAYNERDSFLEANTSNAEATSSNYVVDFLSNGFKTGSGSGLNGDGETFIYAAFAEAPFVNSNGVPCNAR